MIYRQDSGPVRGQGRRGRVPAPELKPARPAGGQGRWRQDESGEMCIRDSYLRLDQGWQAVDGALDQVKDMVRQRFGGDWVAMAAQYFDELADFICQTRPQVIGHFDLISKFNEGSALFDESSPAYVKAGCQALERMAGSGALLEVNTGAIGRGYRTQPYPAMPFLKRWRELGGGVILGSDCHDASWLAVGYDLAEARMRQAGYTSAWRLGRDCLFYTSRCV